jgi:hypothetical protein
MRLRKSREVGSGALMKLIRGLGRCVRSLRRVMPSGIVFVLMGLLYDRKPVAIEGSVVN